ncbi:MAG: hypothetical protein ACLRPT_01285 [Akkermansia muciniphila]
MKTIFVCTGRKPYRSEQRVHLLGGTLDVTGLPRHAVTNQTLVEGTDGLLVMNEDQSLILTGNTGRRRHDIDGTAAHAGGVLRAALEQRAVGRWGKVNRLLNVTAGQR